MPTVIDFAGRTAFMTGGASGIGLACVELLLARSDVERSGMLAYCAKVLPWVVRMENRLLIPTGFSPLR